jgi:carbon-monoxide dehydrogenase large subunit
MERIVDAAARQMGIDPIELRRRNLIGAEAMPYRSAVGNVYDSGDFAGVLSAALGLADMDGGADRRSEARRRGRLRGLGVSCFLEHAGGGDEGVVLAVDGERLVARLGVHPSGQGHATIFRDLIADQLKVAAERVIVEQGDSNLPIRGRPAVGSRSTNAAGSAIVEGVTKLIATGSARAANIFGAEQSAVVYCDGYFSVPGTNHRLSLFDLADRLAQSGAGDVLTTIAHADPATTYPNGCHIAEVEIDPETGKVELVRYAAVDDCGVVLNHTLAEAQVVGGAVQGIGQALLEEIIYGDDGQLLTGTLLDYAMPRAGDVPAIQSVFRPVRCRTNQLGVKGVGEAGTTAAIAAVMNAIADAIPKGRGIAIEMPATPEKVWRACQTPG